MKIESMKDLKALIALCRKTGVQSIRVDGIEMHLGAEPRPALKMPKAAKKTGTVPQAPGPEPTIDDILSDGPTAEQLLFWSTTAQPDSSAASNEN